MKRIYLILFLLLVSIVFADNTEWKEFGNNGSLKSNYQVGNNEFVLAKDNSINFGTIRQPYIVDLDNDGNKEFFIFTTNKLKIYHSNLTFIEEITTSATYWNNSGISDFIYDVADFNTSDSYKEILVINAPISSNRSGQFEIYVFDGVNIYQRKSFPLYQSLNSTSQMRCTVDYDQDGDLDCMFIAENYEKTNITLMGFDINTENINQFSFNISSDYNSYIREAPPPQFLDANRDGNLDALFYAGNNIFIFNQTSLHVKVGGAPLDAGWYQKDSGDYEFVSFGVTAPLGMQLKYYDYDGNVLASASDECPGGSGNEKGGIAINTIEQGGIYTWGFATGGGYYLCKYDKDGNRLFFRSIDMIPLGYTSAYGTNVPFTIADMYGSSVLEFVSVNSVYATGGDDQKLYTTLGSTNGWCLPVNLDGDSYVELICSNSSNIYTFDEEASGGGAENQRPNIDHFVLDNYFLNINEDVEITIYAYDNENDLIYYAVECDYESGAEESYTMNNYPGSTYNWTSDDNDFKTCSYPTNGTKTIKVWVNDNQHDGENELLSRMDNLDMSLYVGDIYIPCFGHFMFCETFNYYAPLTYNGWLVGTPDDIFSYDLTPTNYELFVNNESYYIYHFFEEHKYPIISISFNLSINYSVSFDEINFILLDENNDEQTFISFVDNAVTVATGSNGYYYVGSYSNNTWHNYNLIVYYEDIKGIGNNTVKIANTFDLVQDGNRIAEDLIFYHGFDGKTDINTTEDSVYYSSYIGFKFNHYIVGKLYAKLDDIYIYKGTSFEYDNTADLLVIPTIPVKEDEEIIEYWGCWIVKGEDKGDFDCTYKQGKCHKCCGYVGGILKPISMWCAITKVVRMYAIDIRTWFFENIWYFVFFGGMLITIAFLIKYLKGG